MASKTNIQHWILAYFEANSQNVYMFGISAMSSLTNFLAKGAFTLDAIAWSKLEFSSPFPLFSVYILFLVLDHSISRS